VRDGIHHAGVIRHADAYRRLRAFLLDTQEHPLALVGGLALELIDHARRDDAIVNVISI